MISRLECLSHKVFFFFFFFNYFINIPTFKWRMSLLLFWLLLSFVCSRFILPFRGHLSTCIRLPVSASDRWLVRCCVLSITAATRAVSDYPSLLPRADSVLYTCLTAAMCILCAFESGPPVQNGVPHGSWVLTHSACSACRNGWHWYYISAGFSNWEVLTATILGSDHYPVSCLVRERVKVSPGAKIPKWVFGKADWDEFQKLSEEKMTRINMSGEIDKLNNQVTSAIIMATDGSRSKNTMNRKVVPW